MDSFKDNLQKDNLRQITVSKLPADTSSFRANLQNNDSLNLNTRPLIPK